MFVIYIRALFILTEIFKRGGEGTGGENKTASVFTETFVVSRRTARTRFPQHKSYCFYKQVTERELDCIIS